MHRLEGDGLKTALKDKAHQLGFVLAGVTTADPPESFPVFNHWVAQGKQAGMDYLATQRSLSRRADPRKILPECQSILVLGVPYFPARTMPGRIAAYAWGEDYHEVLKPRLQALVSFLEQQVGRAISNRWYTDTGPILERDLAMRAGLGWIGKNSMLINPKMGSYFLLAEILLGIELPSDDSFKSDHCGTCTRCLEICPTECILPDRTLEASRCISYLTIENKGEIPVALREKIGEWLFGCDLCQQVCPWNRFAPQEGDRRFSARPGVPPDDPAGEFDLSAGAFNRKFKGSPIKRAKRRGYLRNAAVVLGNRRMKTDVSGLAIGIRDPERLVRQHAAWALGKIGGEAAQQYLLEALGHESENAVINEIRAALKRLDSS